MFWIYALLLLVVIVGQTELIVTLVNRIHGLPLPHWLLRKIRHVHDVLIPTLPIVVLWFVGIGGPGLLSGGSWTDLPMGWAAYFVFCGFGAIGLLMTVVTRGLRTIPASQLKDKSWTVDIAKRLGKPPLAEGPYQFMTRVPGNEIFQVQVAEKTFQLPRLPVEWEDLSILHLTDLHLTGTLDRPFFEVVTELAAEMKADMIVFTGDLIDKQELTEWLPSTLGRLKAPLGCYYILGNHDWNLDPRPIRDMMNNLGWQDVSGRCEEVDINGRTLTIAGTEKPWMGQHPDFSRASSDTFRLLLSHTPDNINWARGQNVDLMLSGHNHGGQVQLPLIGPVYSPSVYGTRYASGVCFGKNPRCCTSHEASRASIRCESVANRN